MLARDLIPQLQERVQAGGGEVHVWDRRELDIADREAVIAKIASAAPAVVVNCAAYTDVDGCEANTALAMRINGEAPGFLAEACHAVNAALVHYGSDFVFDGGVRRPYRLEDNTNPLSTYGKSKLAGERAIIQARGFFLIIRTSWLFGLHGRNFVEAILAKAQKGERLRVVDDQVGRPTFSADLGEATVRLLDSERRGVMHFANSGQCSWHEFAAEIVRQAGLEVPVETLSSSELGRPAKRPAYSVLDLSSYEAASGVTPRRWQEALADYMTRRKIGGTAA